MDIKYKSKKLETICTNYSEAKKKYGQAMAAKIHLRIDQLKAVENVETMINSKIGRCHLLNPKEDRRYALDLEGLYRLVFSKEGGKVQVVCIEEIVDYH